MAPKTGGIPLKDLISGKAFAQLADRMRATTRLANELRRLGGRKRVTLLDVATLIGDQEISLDLVALLIAKDRDEMAREIRAARSEQARKAAQGMRRAEDWDGVRLKAFRDAYARDRGGSAYGWRKEVMRKGCALSSRQISKRVTDTSDLSPPRAPRRAAKKK